MGYLLTARNNPITVWNTKRTAAYNSRHKPIKPSCHGRLWGSALCELCHRFLEPWPSLVAGLIMLKQLPFTEIGIRDAYLGNQDVQQIVRCLLSLPVLPLVKLCRLSVTFGQRLLMTANTWKVWRSVAYMDQQAFCRARTLECTWQPQFRTNSVA